MQKSYERNIKKEILERCFKYFVQKGLEQASIKNLCQETGISSGSIYYWFKNRDDTIMEAAKFGMGMVVDEMFNYALANTQDLQLLINSFFDRLILYKKELRFIYQVIMSEKYGADMRSIIVTLKTSYDSYGEKLSYKLNIPYAILKPYVYMFISSVTNYIVWEDYETIQMEIKCICEAVENIIIKD